MVGKEAVDPVHQDMGDGKWYFWLPNWADRQGPFKTEEQARFYLETYIEFNH